MSKKLTDQEKKARLARRVARLSKFPTTPPRKLAREEVRASTHEKDSRIIASQKKHIL